MGRAYAQRSYPQTRAAQLINLHRATTTPVLQRFLAALTTRVAVTPTTLSLELPQCHKYRQLLVGIEFPGHLWLAGAVPRGLVSVGSACRDGL
jgi:hypothetical protein